MSPGEDEEAGGAVAVAEEEPAPIPAPEDEPEAEQEPTEAEPGEGGTEDTEGAEDEDAAVREAVAEYLKEHPDALPEEMRPKEAADWLVQTLQQESQRAVAEQASQALRYGPQAVPQATRAWLKDNVEAVVERGVQDILNNRSEGIKLDTDQLAGQLTTYVEQAVRARASYTEANMTKAVLDMISQHPTARYLAPEHIAWVEEQTRGKPEAERIKAFVWLGMELASQSAPEEIKNRTRADVEKELKSTEAKARILATVGRKTGLKGSGGGGPSITNIDQANEAYLDGKISHDTYKKYREQFGVKD